jgi:hypothetical protein
MLKNDNRSGDPMSAPRCGARTRAGVPCRGPAIKGKARCRMHGGRSTGPRTPEGRERSRRARWKHGRYSIESRRQWMAVKAETTAMNAKLQAYRRQLLARCPSLRKVFR